MSRLSEDDFYDVVKTFLTQQPGVQEGRPKIVADVLKTLAEAAPESGKLLEVYIRHLESRVRDR